MRGLSGFPHSRCTLEQCHTLMASFAKCVPSGTPTLLAFRRRDSGHATSCRACPEPSLSVVAQAAAETATLHPCLAGTIMASTLALFQSWRRDDSVTYSGLRAATLQFAAMSPPQSPLAPPTADVLLEAAAHSLHASARHVLTEVSRKEAAFAVLDALLSAAQGGRVSLTPPLHIHSSLASACSVTSRPSACTFTLPMPRQAILHAWARTHGARARVLVLGGSLKPSSAASAGRALRALAAAGCTALLLQKGTRKAFQVQAVRAGVLILPHMGLAPLPDAARCVGGRVVPDASALASWSAEQLAQCMGEATLRLEPCAVEPGRARVWLQGGESAPPAICITAPTEWQSKAISCAVRCTATVLASIVSGISTEGPVRPHVALHVLASAAAQVAALPARVPRGAATPLYTGPHPVLRMVRTITGLALEAGALVVSQPSASLTSCGAGKQQVPVALWQGS